MTDTSFALVYLDSSVILRVLLDEKNKLREFHKVKQGAASQIVKLECLRTIDRLRQVITVTDEEIQDLREIFFRLYSKLILIPLSDSIIDAASQPLNLPIKSLDAIHLVSCQLLSRMQNTPVPLFTHDQKLALAARSVGIESIGV